MLEIKSNNEIQLTRGDTARLSVLIQNEETKALYEMDPEDELQFIIRGGCKGSDPLLKKSVLGGNEIKLHPEDTANLPCGRYCYDVKLNMKTGDVYTVIEDKRIVLSGGAA